MLGKGLRMETLPYSIVEEEEIITKHEIEIEGRTYSGWCGKCNRLVPKEQAEIFINRDGVGHLTFDVFHKSCSG